MPDATSARLAEWILSQVIPPERAAAAMGDWMEQSFERGSVWFWSCVVRTVIAQILSDLAARPETMARLGLIGFIRNMLVPVAFFLIVNGPFRHGDIRYTHDWLWNSVMVHVGKNPSDPPHWALRWQVSLAMNLLWASVQFQTGRWIARRIPGREMSGCFVIAMIGWAVMFVTTVWSFMIGFSMAPSVLATGIAHDVALFAGALLIRRKFLQIATP